MVKSWCRGFCRPWLPGPAGTYIGNRSPCGQDSEEDDAFLGPGAHGRGYQASCRDATLCHGALGPGENQRSPRNGHLIHGPRAIDVVINDSTTPHLHDGPGPWTKKDTRLSRPGAASMAHFHVNTVSLPDCPGPRYILERWRESAPNRSLAIQQRDRLLGADSLHHNRRLRIDLLYTRLEPVVPQHQRHMLTTLTLGELLADHRFDMDEAINVFLEPLLHPQQTQRHQRAERRLVLSCISFWT